jgi:hypothetical protein
MGDGGGSWSASGEPTVAVSADEGELGEGSESERLTLLCGDLPLFPDLTEAASDLSGTSLLDSMAELLGLSVLPEPGILERSERNERDESLVSDRLKEGYDCKTSSLLAAGLEDAAPASLELWLPMVSQCQRGSNSGMEKVKGLDGVRVSGCGSGRVAFEYPHSLPLHPSRSDCLPGVSPRS